MKGFPEHKPPFDKDNHMCNGIMRRESRLQCAIAMQSWLVDQQKQVILHGIQAILRVKSLHMVQERRSEQNHSLRAFSSLVVRIVSAAESLGGALNSSVAKPLGGRFDSDLEFFLMNGLGSRHTMLNEYIEEFLFRPPAYPLSTLSTHQNRYIG
jgi:hypothetical protein